MRTIKISIEYNGSNYHGWQKQINALTIQEVLEETLQKITGEVISIAGSGRTDAGVHAYGQVASFIIDSKIEDIKLQKSFNGLLPRDIVVTNLSTVESSFHARLSSKGKKYRYIVFNRSSPSPFDFRMSWFVPQPLNLENMKRASMFLIGNNDFSSFRSSSCNAINPVRNLQSIYIEKEGDRLCFWFEGEGFLKQMIRSIVGTLVEVGRGRFYAEDIKKILDAKDRSHAGVTAPPYGLTLMEVYY